MPVPALGTLQGLTVLEILQRLAVRCRAWLLEEARPAPPAPLSSHWPWVTFSCCDVETAQARFLALPGLMLLRGDKGALGARPQASATPPQLQIRESSCAQERVFLQTGSVVNATGSRLWAGECSW